MRSRALLVVGLALLPAVASADSLLMTQRLTREQVATAELDPAERAAVEAAIGGAVVDASHGGLCTGTDARTLCLHGGRFSITVSWRLADGTTGAGTPIQLTSESGYFWFFGPTNIELVIKVLNACAFNDRFWVFAAGLTNVEFTLIVFDRIADIGLLYLNPQGRPVPPIQDTNALPTCP